MSMVGRTVRFGEWNDSEEWVVVTGVVEEEFREPEWEDRYQRLNYGVRDAQGQYHTPYAHECEPVEPEPKQHIRAVAHDGGYWHALEYKGRTLLFSRCGNVGECVRF